MGIRLARSRRRESGAAVLEFAVVSTLLFPILFGIVDYGLWFGDRLNVEKGVREAASAGVTGDFACAEDARAGGFEALACRVEQEIGRVTGPTYVKIAAPDGWTEGSPLLVCAMVKAEASIGLVPLPEDGLLRSQALMSIEEGADLPDESSFTTLAAPDSVGHDWSWCSARQSASE